MSLATRIHPAKNQSPQAMTLGEHFGELRYRLIVCVATFTVMTALAAIAYEPILHVLIRPLCSVDVTRVPRRAPSMALPGWAQERIAASL